jgi:hypothetical protein
MSVLIKKIIDVSTDTFIEREMNQQETDDFNKTKSNILAKNQEEAKKSEARLAAEAKLLALGLTTEDLKALLG